MLGSQRRRQAAFCGHNRDKRRCRGLMFTTSLLGLLDPFPQKVGIDPVVQRKPRNRHTRRKARRNETRLRCRVIPPSAVSQNPPDNQPTFVTLNHLVSTSVKWTLHAARHSMTKGAGKFAFTFIIPVLESDQPKLLEVTRSFQWHISSATDRRPMNAGTGLKSYRLPSPGRCSRPAEWRVKRSSTLDFPLRQS